MAGRYRDPVKYSYVLYDYDDAVCENLKILNLRTTPLLDRQPSFMSSENEEQIEKREQERFSSFVSGCDYKSSKTHSPASFIKKRWTRHTMLSTWTTATKATAV
jgi:hypothetical protein